MFVYRLYVYFKETGAYNEIGAGHVFTTLKAVVEFGKVRGLIPGVSRATISRFNNYGDWFDDRRF